MQIIGLDGHPFLISEVATPEELYSGAIHPIAHHAPGGHADPNNPCYATKRQYKDFAVRVVEAVQDARATRA